jgi:hypothetical protein
MLYSSEASASMEPFRDLMNPSAILQLRLATTDPLFGEGHHSNGCDSNDCTLKRVIPDKEEGRLNLNGRRMIGRSGPWRTLSERAPHGFESA